MRDAIQGMLSMSRMGDGQQLFRDKRSAAAHRLQQRNQMIMEEEAKLEQCYKDEEFSKSTPVMKQRFIKWNPSLAGVQ